MGGPVTTRFRGLLTREMAMWRSGGRYWFVASMCFWTSACDRSRMLSMGVGVPSPWLTESRSIEGVMEVRGKICWLRAPIQKRMVRADLAMSAKLSHESAAAVAAAKTMPLGVARGAAHPLADDAGMDAEDLAHDLVVGELDEPDQGEAHGGGDEVVDVGSGLGAAEPRHDVQAFGEQLLGAGMVGQALQQLGRAGDELADEVGVRLEELAELLEVLLDVSLAAEYVVQVGGAVVGGPEEGRLVVSDGAVGDGASGVVAADHLELLGVDAGQARHEGVNLVPAEKGALELVQYELQNLLVGALGVIFALLHLVGDVAHVASDQLGDRRRFVILGELVRRSRQASSEAVL